MHHSFINSWFDKHRDKYVDQILQSKLGTHQNRHRLFKMLSITRKIAFFKKIIPFCLKNNLKGFTAGSFMLGRFICIPQPIKFWKEINDEWIVFLLNEFILFEKYLQVLNDIGERKVNRARNEILDNGLGSIQLKKSDALIFVNLKLIGKDWDKIIEIINDTHDPETIILINILKKPYGAIFDYNLAWSVSQLEEICKKENLPLPHPDTI